MAMTGENHRPISSGKDLEQVHYLRARSDAILVGAETLRKDNCRLTVRYGQGSSRHLTRVTLTRSGCIDLKGHFFADDGARQVIFWPQQLQPDLQEALRHRCVVKTYEGESCPAMTILQALGAEGVRELMIEGGASVISLFLRERLVDRVRLAIGPQIAGLAGNTRLFDSIAAVSGTGTDWRCQSVQNFDGTVAIWYETGHVVTD